ncbi:Isoquinoline 1-oxidoreductase subunit [Hyphomicrobium sp.]|uniref:Isoquinoline 1-oxidoreductase subunit n=1 Tax=Hyphomicrobium sp. TaxID=82 RepID=UPI003FA5CB55
MRTLVICFAGAAMIITTGVVGNADQKHLSQLKLPSSFSAIPDKKERSIALFIEAGKVIMSPRCVNCHPAGDRPSQGEDGRPHQPLVVRGPDGLGAMGMRCTSCHGPTNFDPGQVPGHPKWHLAPIEMAWQGKTLGQICEQIKDKDRNGGMTLDAIIHHMAEDELVGWGWHPRVGRVPAPGTQSEFGELIRAWVETGAACPAS